MALADNLLSYYNLQTNSNDNFGSRNGTDTSITYSSGAVMDAVTDKISFSDSAIGTSDFTINFWVNTTTFTANSGYYAIYNGTNYFLIYQDSTTPQKVKINYHDAGDTFFTSSGSISSGVTTMVTAVRSAGTITIYLNGSSSGGSSGYTSKSLSGTTSEGLGNTLNNAVVGTYKYLGIWKRALSGAEITTLYNSGSGLAYPFPGTGNPAFFMFV